MLVRRLPRPFGEHPLRLWKAGIDKLYEEMDRWFDEPTKSVFSALPAEWELKTPRAEVCDTGENLVVSVELPGVEKSDLEVKVYPTYVSVNAEKRQQNEVKADSYYHSECYYGSISRNIPLPVEVDPAQAKAEFKNGVLKLDLPKKHQGDIGRKIDIE